MFDHTPQVVSFSITPDVSTTVDAIDADLFQSYRWHLLLDGNRYVRTRIYWKDVKPHEKTYLLHRLILERVIGRTLDRWDFVDHIDGDTLNNTRANLRLASLSENLRNRKRHKNNRSGYKGVYEDKRQVVKKWRAQISVNGTQYRLGFFETPEEAYKAYCEAAEELHGKFARLK